MRRERGRALLIPNSGKCPPSGFHPQAIISLFLYIQLSIIFYQFFLFSVKLRIPSLHPFTIWGLIQGPIIWLDELTCLELRNWKKKKKLVSFFSWGKFICTCPQGSLLFNAMQGSPVLWRLSAFLGLTALHCLDAEQNKSSYSFPFAFLKWFNQLLKRGMIPPEYLCDSALLLTSNWLVWPHAFNKPISHTWSLPSWFYLGRHLFVRLHALVLLLVINFVYYDFSINFISPFFLPLPFNDFSAGLLQWALSGFPTFNLTSSIPTCCHCFYPIPLGPPPNFHSDK